MDIDAIKRMNYKYGHILIRVAQGRITDQKALNDRLDNLEKKIIQLLGDSEIKVEFDRNHKPLQFLYKMDAPYFPHLPYFPLKFTDKKQDVSHQFFINESGGYTREMAERKLN